MRNPYELRWNFDIQRELPGGMALEVGYVGNHGVHLPITIQEDYVPRQVDRNESDIMLIENFR